MYQNIVYLKKKLQLAANYIAMFKLVNTIFNKISYTYLTIGMLLFFSSSLIAQSSRYDNPDRKAGDFMPLKQGWFVGMDVGNTIFYGDVALYNNYPKFKDFKVSAGRCFNISGGKKFKFGLAAEAQLFKGTLKGEKQADKLYPRYFNADITGYSVNAKYNLSQLLFREKSDRSFFNRLTLHITVGGGQVFFRSRLYKYAINNQWYLEKVSGYTSEGIDSAGVSAAGGLVADKAKTISAFILPIGGKLSFKLNNKTNLILNANYVTVFSDQVDSWSRSWSHKDRYLYTGIGFVFNFTQEAEDVPNSDRLFRPGSKKSRSSSRKSDGGDAYDKEGSSGGGLFKKRGEKVDKDLEIKLKLYELQLKLFEMQYLVK